jgi:hypothetical protein
VAYAFSWFGCLYDLSIPFLLVKKTTRGFAYAAVIIFHSLTALLFPIGVFPYIMIATALIFFSADFHNGILIRIGRWIKAPAAFIAPEKKYAYPPVLSNVLLVLFSIFFFVQVTLPMRHMFYSGELFWTEEGYRFSWRVMLMEKAGYAQFMVKDSTGKQVIVDNAQFLTTLQEKMMSTQPDMLLQYAHILREYYSRQGFESPQVYVDSYVALNGRLGRPLVNSVTDLASLEDSFGHKHWIMPFENEIKGF